MSEPRCPWASSVPEFGPYHDDEWGYPVDDDVRLFEKMSLESFQSGLSWRTILNKRDNFRAAFAGFDPERVARFADTDVARLLADAGIVRHRGKITAVIHNASVALELASRHGSLAAFVWRFEPQERRVYTAQSQHPAQTAESRALAKALKAEGWRFFGPTTAYAFMQAMGLVNDHVIDCACHARAEAARAAFRPPA